MPLGPRSRYQSLPVVEASDRKGQTRPTVGMRLVSPLNPLATNFRHAIAGMQPLEYLSYRYFNSSDDWWRIADINEVRFPLDWTTGEVVNIPSATQVGLVVRTRKL